MNEILDLLGEEIFVVNGRYEILFLNNVVKRRVNEQRGFCFKVIERLEAPCSFPLWECPLPNVMKNGKSVIFVHPVGKAPSVKYLRIGVYPLQDGNFVEIREDVTAERELEREILIHHNHLDAISRISSAVAGLRNLTKILETSLDTLLEIFSGSIGGILLYDEKKEELSCEVYRGIPLEFGDKKILKEEEIFGEVLKKKEPLVFEDLSKIKKFSETFFFEKGIRSITIVPLKAKEKVVGILTLMSTTPNEFDKEDMYLLSSIGYQLGMAIEQVKLYERLKNARERYKKLLEITFAIQEEERKRIARELHDETSQNLTALSLNLSAIKEMIEREGLTEDVKELITKSHSIAVNASVELTKIIRELRPTLLDTLGLPAAINHLMETNLRTKGIKAEVEFEGIERMPQDVELALFRITQEAISNIVRHSKAKNVKIILGSNEKEWFLRIEDDGVGFEIENIKTIEDGGRGAGLFGMRERLRLVGGYGWIDSALEKGTKIIAFIPKKAKRDEEDKDFDSR